MKIVAIICVRNELTYLREVIPYLNNENIEVILIDNDSTDGTLNVASGADYGNIQHVERLPFNGRFDLSAQLNAKAAVIENIDADWIVHQDADEILQSPTDWGGLRHHVELADSMGFNVLNFNEIVMLPANPDIDDFIHNNTNYYFFEPRPLRLMRAWKKSAKLANFRSGGHVLHGDDVVVYPARMLLKHFIVRSQHHAFEKYLGRRFASTDLEKGWHGNRLGFTEKNLIIPTCGSDLYRLEDVKNTPAKLPRSSRTHFWEWPRSDWPARVSPCSG
jgi:glycosyltransferase involved in cell wall biosynthesis